MPESDGLYSVNIVENEQTSPTLNWENAAKVPWTECVRDPLRQPQPTSDQESYFQNNQMVRTKFLQLLTDMQSEGNNLEEFKNRFAQLHRTLILGDGEHTYTMPDQQKKIGERSPFDIAGNFGDHPEEWDTKLADLQTRLADFISPKNTNLSQSERVHQIGQIFFNSLNGYPAQFSYGNNSLNMNIVNGLLRLTGMNGISHGDLDIEFMLKMNAERFPEKFLTAVSATNPTLSLHLIH